MFLSAMCSCNIWYQNIADGLRVVLGAATTTAGEGGNNSINTALGNFPFQMQWTSPVGDITSGLWPISSKTGFYGIGCTPLSNSLSFLATKLFPVGSSKTGFFGLSTSVYTRVAQVIFPAIGNSGLYRLPQAALRRLFNFLSQALYKSQTSIRRVVQLIHSNAPTPHVATTLAAGEGQPGIQEKAILDGQSSWIVTAGCKNGIFLMGGWYEVACTTTAESALATPPSAAQLLELASTIVSIQSAAVITGHTIATGGSFAVTSAKVTAIAVGSTDPGLSYYGPVVAPMCQRVSAPCTPSATAAGVVTTATAAGAVTSATGAGIVPSSALGCCSEEGKQGGPASCDCSSCDGSNAGVSSGCAAGCRCYTSGVGYTDTDCGPVGLGENFWGCVCKVRAIPVCHK
jgi:hypothetical protein